MIVVNYNDMLFCDWRRESEQLWSSVLICSDNFRLVTTVHGIITIDVIKVFYCTFMTILWSIFNKCATFRKIFLVLFYFFQCPLNETFFETMRSGGKCSFKKEEHEYVRRKSIHSSEQVTCTENAADQSQRFDLTWVTKQLVSERQLNNSRRIVPSVCRKLKSNISPGLTDIGIRQHIIASWRNIGLFSMVVTINHMRHDMWGRCNDVSWSIICGYYTASIVIFTNSHTDNWWIKWENKNH